METITRKTLLYKTNVEYGDYCLNHVLGCSHGCLYPCYAYLLKKRTGAVKDYQDWISPKIVGNTMELLEKEVHKYKNKIKSVHLCFSTDPFMFGQPEIHMLTAKIIRHLNLNDIPCSILTKGLYPIPDGWGSIYDLFGITLVSVNEAFREKYEPGASNLKDRIIYLKQLHSLGFKTWVSMEPYPTPNIVEQDIDEILNSIKFVDKIVFGRMNYNALTAGYEEFYKEQAKKVSEFCLKNGIECYIKRGTV
jgi:DNA repair photolyase